MSERIDTQVEADLLTDGTVRPRSFVWQGRKHAVTDIGRQWNDPQARHVLVMNAQRQTFELVLAMPTLTWSISLVGRDSTVA